MHAKQLIVFFPLLFALSSFAQPTCGFDDAQNAVLRRDSSYKKKADEIEKTIQACIAKHKAARSADNAVVYNIPVVVHVMHTGGEIGTVYNPTDERIQNAIAYLNQVYSGTYPGTEGAGDMQLRFALATKDPACNPTSGIERIDASGLSGYIANGVSNDYGAGSAPGVNELSLKDLSRWNPYQYYNIWVVNKINGRDGTSGSYISGFAFYPFQPAAYDGMVLLATHCLAGDKALPHEMGHAFGLRHVFQGSIGPTACPANNDCTVDGDRVCDTDPISYNTVAGGWDETCRSGINPCTNAPYNINTEHNYMNYTACHTLFTEGQKERVLAIAATVRKSLAGTLAFDSGSPSVSFTPPKAATCTPLTGFQGVHDYFAGILSVDLNNRSVGSSDAYTDTGYVDGTASCMNLIQLTKGATNTLTITDAGFNEEQIGAWIDFNNDGQFDDATEKIFFNPDVKADTASGTFIVPANAVLNTVLRMRVMDDLTEEFAEATISPCYNPTFGQAEDYPVLITAGTLPVNLVSFSGTMENDATQLRWRTETEEALKNYTIEKSTDGLQFFEIARVAAEGTANRSHNYSFRDNHPGAENYYRLRMNNVDGTYATSRIVFLRNHTKQHLLVLNNPFSTYVDLRFQKQGLKAKLQLFNATGAMMAQKIVSEPQGQIRWYLPAQLSRGYYLLKADVDGELFTDKLVKQ